MSDLNNNENNELKNNEAIANNNLENSPQAEEQKQKENLRENVEALKTTASLAKNAASGNVVGAAKDAIKLAASKKGKKMIKRMIITSIIKSLIPILIICALGGALYSIFDAVGDVVQNVISKIADFFTIDNDGAIEIDNNQIDEIINGISGLGVSMDGLKLLGDVDYTKSDIQEENQKALRKYIREFYEAQAMTQTLNTKPGWISENYLHGGKPYGTVYVYRTDGEKNAGTGTQLKYKAYDEMVKLKDSGNTTEILKYFSVNDGKLIVPAYTTTKVEKKVEKEVEKNYIQVSNAQVSNNTSITLREVDYKSAISQYTTSMNFFVYLTLITQNAEFLSAVTDLVKNSEIRLTVIDTDTTSEDTEAYTYTKNVHKIWKKWVEGNAYLGSEGHFELQDDVTKDNFKETTTTTITSKVPTVKVTYVKTWFCEQNINYELDDDVDSERAENYNYADDEPEPTLVGEGEVTWITGQKWTYSSHNKIKRYKDGVAGDVVSRLGKKGSQGILDLNGNGKVDSNERVDENSTFIGLLDNKFKIPNSTRYDSAGGNIISGAQMIFYLLEKDSSSQNLEQILKYALYLYSGRDYGVTNLNWSLFQAGNVINLGTTSSAIYGSSIEDKVWFTLKSAGYSDEAVAGAMGNIKWESGGFNPSAIEGGSGIGFGLCQWSYGRRTALEAYAASKGKQPSDEDTQVEFLLTELTPGAQGPAQGYASYQLLYYHGYNGDMWSKASTPEEAATAFCWSFERPKTADGNSSMSTRRQYAREYYEKYKGMTAPLSGTIIQVADEIHKYMEQNNYTYCVYGGNSYEECNGSGHGLNTTFEESKNGYHHACCATYVSWVLQASGFISDSEHTDSAEGVRNLLVRKGWKQISSALDLQPGDVIYYNNGHVEIFAGDGTVYNAGSGNAIRGSSPQRKNVSKMTSAFRAPQ